MRDGREYRRREPEKSLLYRVVSAHLDAFLARAAELAEGSGLPRFVERELRAYLRCGILEHGFVRVHCDVCGKDALVAFSCKGRGFCPSCSGRRMAATAAHLVDHVLPRVPVRQWVLSLPIRLRYQIAFDRDLGRRVRNLFVRAVLGSIRRRARQAGVRDPVVGAVTSVQRFGSALNLNVHFHTLVLDGVYRDEPGGCGFDFVPLAAPPPAELERLLRRIRSRIAALLQRRGLGRDESIPSSADGLAETEASLAACTAGSLQHCVALGRTDGQPIARRRKEGRADAGAFPKEGCFDLEGFSLHANVRVAARDLCHFPRSVIELALKTTLLRILVGDVEPDRGAVRLPRGLRVGYLEQDFTYSSRALFRALHPLPRPRITPSNPLRPGRTRSRFPYAPAAGSLEHEMSSAALRSVQAVNTFRAGAVSMMTPISS